MIDWHAVFAVILILSPILCFFTERSKRALSIIISANLCLHSAFGEMAYYMGFIDKMGSYYFLSLSFWSFLCISALYSLCYKCGLQFRSREATVYIALSFCQVFSLTVFLEYPTHCSVFYDSFTKYVVLYNIVMLYLMLRDSKIAKYTGLYTLSSRLDYRRNYRHKHCSLDHIYVPGIIDNREAGKKK